MINGVIQSTTPVFTGNSASADDTTSALLTNPYSAEAIYTITSNGEGQFNGGIDINAATTPIPAALPMFLGGLGVLGFVTRKRKTSGQLSAA